ncbi:calcium-binding protein, partial [Pseudomonas sp. PSB11]|uniref:calcium-binding protein n=1 Tax=Pseudomonas sp. PSB11 TaxID=2021969 RepID=UPI002948BDF3
ASDSPHSQLYGEDGNDTLILSGNSFAATLGGGNGNDTLDVRSFTGTSPGFESGLFGGAGSDLYRVGDGAHIYIFDNKDNTSPTDNNVVEFAAGIDLASLQLSRSGNDLIVTFATGKTLIIPGQFATGGNGNEGGVQTFRFADGTTWDRAAIRDHLPILNGNGGDDILNGDARSEEINGFAGSDTLNGNDGSDTLDGGDGDDTL